MCLLKNKSFTEKVSFWNLFAIIATLIVLFFYTGYTKDIANEAIKTTQINSRPLLSLTYTDTEGDQEPYNIRNFGKGPALNVIVVVRDIKSNGIFLSNQGDMLIALPQDITMKIPRSNLQELSTEEAKTKLPGANSLIEELSKKQNNQFALVYEDIFGNTFATIFKGSIYEYGEGIEFAELQKNDYGTQHGLAGSRLLNLKLPITLMTNYESYSLIIAFITMVGAIIFAGWQIKINRRLQKLNDFVALSILPDTNTGKIKLLNTGKINLYIHGFEINGVKNKFDQGRLISSATLDSAYYWLPTDSVPPEGKFDIKIYLMDEFNKKFITTGQGQSSKVDQGKSWVTVWTLRTEKTNW